MTGRGWTFEGPSRSGPIPHDIHSYDWHDTDETVTLPDPLYGAPQVMGIYRVDLRSGPLTFAYTEVTNGVDLFAVPS